MPLSAPHNITRRNMVVASLMLMLSMLLTAGCGRHPAGPVITGTLTAGEPVQLSETARLELILTDVTGLDGAGVEIARVDAGVIKSLPFSYSLPYDASRIDSAHRYMVDARVRVDGQLRYTTDSAFPVLTEGHGATRDMQLALAGQNSNANVAINNVNSTGAASNNEPARIYHGEWRAGQQASVYAAGFTADGFQFIEEDRGTGAGILHVRYDFHGAYLRQYRDSSPLQIRFDEHGRPVEVIQGAKVIDKAVATELVNDVRNRASLLRSAALAGSETKQHRDETEGLVPAQANRPIK